MSERDISLRSASISQLVEELARRHNASSMDEPPEAWCDDCANFRYAGSESEGRKSYNPCMKRHQMEFYMPQPHDSPETFGFYRLVCKDRAPRHDPVENLPQPRGFGPTRSKKPRK